MRCKVKILIISIFCQLIISGNVYSYTIDKFLAVQPIIITHSIGTPFWDLNDNDISFYETGVDAIWAQAGIDIGFNLISMFEAPVYGSIDFDELITYDMWGRPAPSTFWPKAESDPSSSQDPDTINMWITRNITDFEFIAGLEKPGPEGVYGGVAGDGFLIFQSALNSIEEVLAHELGHILSLEHAWLNPFAPWNGTDPSNLMSDTVNGNTILSSSQIEIARASRYLQDISPVPEPSTLILLCLGFSGLSFVVCRRTKE